MKKLLLTVILNTLLQATPAQTISSETIKKDVTAFLTDSTAEDYWVKVIHILETDESKLTEHQYYLLYYMQGAKPEKVFPSLCFNQDRLQLKSLAGKSKFKKAIPIGESLIKINPVDIVTLVYLAMSIDMNSGDKENRYYLRMKNIITAIFKTGNGKTPDTAIKIANIDDDAGLLGFTGFPDCPRQDEKINGKHYSVWTSNSGDKFYFEYVLIFL